MARMISSNTMAEAVTQKLFDVSATTRRTRNQFLTGCALIGDLFTAVENVSKYVLLFLVFVIYKKMFFEKMLGFEFLYVYFLIIKMD